MKNTKKEITPEPLFAQVEREHPVGFTEDSWVIVSANSTHPTKVFYFNPQTSPEEFADFKEFVEIHIDDEFFCKGDNPEKIQKIEEKFATVSAFDGVMEEDFNEDTGQSWKAAVGYASIMNFYKGGLNLDKVKEIVNTMNKEINDLESEGAYNISDAEAYRKDPYAYHGVSRRDFM